MNISILQENLLKALSKTSRIISSKPQLPILQNVLLEVKEDRLYVVSSNLEVTEKLTIGGKIKEEGAICVSSRLLTEFVSSLPTEAVHIETKDGSLLVSCGKVHATIPGVLSGEFPPVPAVGKITGLILEKESLVKTLHRILFAAATDDSRPLLTGVKIIETPQGIVYMATDGYRLSKEETKTKIRTNLSLVIPARALGEVLKLCQDDKENKQVLLHETPEGYLVFEVGDAQLFTRRIDGEYPNTEKIIPKTFSTQIVVDKEQLTRAVKSAAVFARDNANIIRFHIEDQALTISANTPNVGEDSIELDTKAQGDGGDIAFNSRFLTEFLATIEAEQVVFEMTGSLNPGVFKVAGDDSFLHIIMPVRVQS